jgi:hypothetical protein
MAATSQRGPWRVTLANAVASPAWVRAGAMLAVAATALVVGIFIGQVGMPISVGPSGTASASPEPGLELDSPRDVPFDWIEPNLYEFVIESSCGERSGLGTFRIKVAGGRVDELQRLDAQARRDPMDLNDAPTLGVLLNRAAYASSGNYEPHAGRGSDSSDPVVTVEADPRDGHPTLIAIDWVPEAIDDEECHRILQFETPVTAMPIPPREDPRDDPESP